MTASRQRSRLLIVNADDLGRTAGINAGIFESHREGIVSSATLMV
ncbi:MAG TPA: ChbG/HpnK family deacetylase, partial [Thermoanaerobaculia bacterium]|nr:ChbG/HpnK family deacetylase [Thermoanaerobaculia bacterium]